MSRTASSKSVPVSSTSASCFRRTRRRGAMSSLSIDLRAMPDGPRPWLLSISLLRVLSSMEDRQRRLSSRVAPSTRERERINSSPGRWRSKRSQRCLNITPLRTNIRSILHTWGPDESSPSQADRTGRWIIEAKGRHGSRDRFVRPDKGSPRNPMSPCAIACNVTL